MIIELKSGRSIDVGLVKNDIRFIHENLLGNNTDAIFKKWSVTMPKNPWEVLTYILHRIRSEPRFLTLQTSVVYDWQRHAAQVIKHSHLLDLFNVPDDCTCISLRADVPQELMKELEEFRESLPQGWHGNYPIEKE